MSTKSRAFTAADKEPPLNSAAQQLESADNLTELWEGLLPEYNVPSRAQFLNWAEMCSEQIGAYAINRAARKAHRQKDTDPMDGERLSRYITSIMVHERDGNRTFSRSQTERKTI